MKVLITGGTGYIGSRLAYRLSQSYDVVCLTRTNKRVGDLPTVHGDILDPKKLKSVLKSIDMVIHCAGALGHWQNTNDFIYKVNVTGTENIVQESILSSVQYFIHVSTCGVTGPLGPQPVNENHPCEPSNEYQRTKLLGEKKALALAKPAQFPLSVIRPTFVMGHGDPHKLNLFKMIKKRIFFYIGNGESTLHPVDIEDLLDAFELMMKNKPLNETYIIGGQRPLSMHHIAEAIARECKVSPPKIHIPISIAKNAAILSEYFSKAFKKSPILTVSRVMMMSRHWGYDISKSVKELGYNPQKSFTETVHQASKYYHDHGFL